MAYTSVIPVYRLDNAVRYAQDKQKTTRQHGMPLAETVDYALNREKTETDGFESGLGCTTQSAYEDMRANAVRWHKTDGVQGYHLVQSFAEGEVTPELAHKIGLELAERVLGGRHQAIVTTHLNTSHYHNHIVWSSVAMNSGRKYHSNAKSYALEIRAVSDELCVKYGLSIIQTERAAQVSKPYAEWLAEKNGQPTWRTVIRQDVDAALAEALTWRQFIRELESKGYELNFNHKYPTLRPPGKTRPVRFKTLGRQYTSEALQIRILYPDARWHFLQEQPPVAKHARLRKSYGKARRLTGLRALYYRYLYELGALPHRRLLLNGNSFRLGVSGSGKSMSAKEEIVQIALATEDDILILDPESEFGHLTRALGGEVIQISAASDTHINALDMDKEYGDDRNPIIAKSEFVLSLFEQLAGSLTAAEKSILGRCTELLYKPYLDRGCTGTPPTLKDFYRLLKMQPETEAQGLALSSELFITGTLNTFARHTNVNTRARIIDYDIRELGEQLMPLGMLVTLDAIYNRVIQNWKAGRRTWIVCDEFYLLFRYEYSSNFFYKLWKRIRKYNGLITGLTQNVDELLRSDTARLMLANSEFLIMLNQSATDRGELAKLLNISDTQLGYITNVPAGCGLIRCAGNLVPFTNSFPTDTKLYRLMTTKPDERLKE